MIADTVGIVSAAVAIGAALWAALLAVAQEAHTVSRSLGQAPTTSRDPVPLERALQTSRLGLVLIAATAASLAVAWWTRPLPEALFTVMVTVAFLFVVSDGLPRAAGVLVPRLSAVAAPLARKSLLPFRPLLGLVAAVERGGAFLLPRSGPARPVVGDEERDMLAGVISLRDTTVAEVMTPRLDILAVAADAEWHEVVEHLRRSEHHRIPVCGADLDDIHGILYAKDLTAAIAGIAERPVQWQSLVRPAQFVPESKSLTAQLREFQRSSAHLAIVVDEFGGTSGLVTLEDVLEEVVGEIYGEYDREEIPPVVREGDDRFWVEGTVTLDTLSELLHTELEQEEVSTVGGLVYSELGRVPRPGEELRIGDFRVVVERVERRRIQRVYFERQGAGAETAAEEPA